MNVFHKCSNIHEKIHSYFKFSHLCVWVFFYNSFSVGIKNGKKWLLKCVFCWLLQIALFPYLFEWFVRLPFASTNILITNVKISRSLLCLHINHLCIQTIFVLDGITLSASPGHHRPGLRVLLPGLVTFISIRLHIDAAKVWFCRAACCHVHVHF